VEPSLLFLSAVRALDWQVASQFGPASVGPASPVAPEDLQAQVDRELPLLALAPPAVAVDSFLAWLAEYRVLFMQHHPPQAAEMSRQSHAVDGAGEQVRHALVQAMLAGDGGSLYDLSGLLDVDPAGLLYMGELTVRPYLAAYAGAMRHVADLSGYRGQRCPVCGRRPHLGHIDVENIKHLHCPACETEWRYNRVACAWCGCTNTDKLGFFTVEGDDEHRVEYCGECTGYLKVVNQRVRARTVDWLMEDAATAHLDQLAEAEGYRKGTGQA
jgi:FdhE protein